MSTFWRGSTRQVERSRGEYFLEYDLVLGPWNCAWKPATSRTVSNIPLMTDTSMEIYKQNILNYW